jgi:hypothetical protein
LGGFSIGVFFPKIVKIFSLTQTELYFILSDSSQSFLEPGDVTEDEEIGPLQQPENLGIPQVNG